jgi:N-acetylglucosamine-6-phosphate deacetylase
MGYRKKGLLIPEYDSDVIVFNDRFELGMVIARGEIKKNSFGDQK